MFSAADVTLANAALARGSRFDAVVDGIDPKAQRPLQAAALINRVLPGVITSIFRPSGTHQFGSVDFAPRFPAPLVSAAASGRHLAELGVPNVLVQLRSRLMRAGVQVFLEHDHLHIQHPATLIAADRRLAPLIPSGTLFFLQPGRAANAHASPLLSRGDLNFVKDATPPVRSSGPYTIR